MSEYRWLYVETVRVSKATGKVSRSLKIKLCQAVNLGDFKNIEIEEFTTKTATNAYNTEKMMIKRGDTFVNSIDEFFEDYKLSVESVWLGKKKHKSKLNKIRPADYKLFLKGEYDPK